MYIYIYHTRIGTDIVACTYIYIYMYIYTCIHICIYTQNNLHRDTCMSYIYIYACMYADWGVGFGAFGLGIWG